MLRRLLLPVIALAVLAPGTPAEEPTKVADRTKKEWLKVLAEDEKPRQRAAAVAALMIFPMRDRVVEDAVRNALTDKAPLVRLRALDAVGIIILSESREQSGHIDSMGRVLVKDESEDVRTKALDIIKEFRRDEQQRKAVPFLGDALRGDKNPAIRAGAGAALGRMGSNARPVVNLMVEALRDPDPGVRAAVAEGLGRIGDEAKGSIPKLVLLLKDTDAGVRLAATFALGRIGPEAAAAVPDLANTLASDKDANVRKEAARAFSLLGLDAKPAIPALAKALREDKSEEVRQQAALALGKMRSDELSAAVPAIVEAMKLDADKNVRVFAVHALGNGLGDGLRAYVKDMADLLLKDTDGDVRLALVQALGGLGPAAKEALPALNRAVTDVQLSVRDEAKKAVKKVMEKQ